MKQINSEHLKRIVEANRKYTKKGEVADYIPELGHIEPHLLGVTIAPLHGDVISVGDCGTTFTFQSISKVISLMVALMDHGPDIVFSKVGMEPSGEPFNSIVKLETMEHHKPLNPMINAGAIAVASLIKGKSVKDYAPLM
jgi:glutaminase